MNNLTLTFLLACLTVAAARAQPVEVGDALVEIERQRLVKFPDDLDQSRDPDGTATNRTTDKYDEAKRILEEIEKINHALGYVRKQPEPPKLPPILDSSQYLFPKPAVQPFHQQHHQTAGSNGETILIPSIRAIRPGDQYALQYPPSAAGKSIEYNAPVRKHPKHVRHSTRSQLTASAARQQANSGQTQYFYRPNQVLIPAPQNGGEQQPLPTHFVIPVRLYRLNKEEYLQKYAPQEYRIKGYKIVGDIDHFYGKTKTKNKNKNKAHKHKSTPKYHLFFLPREVALNEDAALEYPTNAKESADATLPPQPNTTSSREEKLTNRPFKIQSTATTNNNNGMASNNATSQVVRKRIVPKPLREKETNVGATAVQQLPGGGVASTSTTIRITPPPIGLTANANANLNLNGNGHGQAGSGAVSGGNFNSNSAPTTNPNASNNNNNFNIFNLRPAANNNNNNNPTNTPADIKSNNTNAANVIKTAFQNIFKFPFRPEPKPLEPAAAVASNLETVPLQTPPKTFFTAPQSLLPQPFYTVDTAAQHNHDYKWDDEAGGSGSGSDSNADEDSDDSTEQEEKKIFGHHHGYYQQQQKQQHDTNKEAIKQGGIVIQRLKVRKGGIAIAGPGGVATAGSGGTAIVGPGGYALTHPRSLTIAGPGAKVIAIPPDVDLKDALQRTDLAAQSFPREGKVVATGPTVYYAPGTGTGTDIASLQTWPLHSSLLQPYTINTPLSSLLQPQAKSLLQPLQSPALWQSPNHFYWSNAPLYAGSLTLPYSSLPLVSVASSTAVVANAATGEQVQAAQRPANPIEATPAKPQTNAADFKSDVRLLTAVSEINPEFVIEDIVPIPGRHILSTVSRTQPEKLIGAPQREVVQPVQAKPAAAATKTQASAPAAKQKLAQQKKLRKRKRPAAAAAAPTNNDVVVESTGRTATSGNIPQIPFGTYFLPYLAHAQPDSGKTAALILEPHSKAVVGNGGTAISMPISRAFLKRGVPTNVYFNPESVAIAGVGGKAHAQADLELDLVDARK